MTPKEIEGAFAEAAYRREAEVKTLGDDHGALSDIREKLDRINRELRKRRNTTLANGGFDGKNAETREAQLQLALDGDPAWLALDLERENLSQSVATYTEHIDVVTYRIAGRTREMEFAIEQFRYLNTPRFYKEI